MVVRRESSMSKGRLSIHSCPHTRLLITTRETMVGTWLWEISFCYCLTVLLGPPWFMLSKTCHSLFTPLYTSKNYRAEQNQLQRILLNSALVIRPVLVNRPILLMFDNQGTPRIIWIMDQSAYLINFWLPNPQKRDPLYMFTSGKQTLQGHVW